MSEIKRERVYVIDLLRFVAAVGVLLYHLTYRIPEIDHLSTTHYPEVVDWARYTNLGVRLFFMISGFVIFYSVEGKTALQYVWSRMTRLYPAYWLCCTLTYFVCHYCWRPHFTGTTRDWLVNLTMLQEYFKVDHIDLPYWTLAEELRFYGVTLVLMLIGQVHRRLSFVAFWMTLCAIDYYVKIPLARYEMTLEHAPLFAAGIIYYDMFKEGIKRVHWPLLIVTFVLGLARFLRSSAIDGATMGAVCSPTVISGIWLGIYVTFFLVATRRLIIRERHFWVTALGGITYPFYLIHNNIGTTMLIALRGSVGRWTALGLVVLFCCAFGYAVWRWFETPIIRWLQSLGKSSSGQTPELPRHVIAGS